MRGSGRVQGLSHLAGKPPAANSGSGVLPCLPGHSWLPYASCRAKLVLAHHLRVASKAEAFSPEAKGWVRKPPVKADGFGGDERNRVQVIETSFAPLLYNVVCKTPLKLESRGC